ncbi:MAG: DegT/DnrJ/EryC1/StrS aminotransferase family protein [Acidimicrobiia bacterium]|nr:DegT/DnrJ/EryC1/StrS aminotransferase family protein [Acidimicrobiia bacterium]
MTFDIPFAKPSITSKEVEYATDAAANGWGRRCYDYLNIFETRFAEYLDVRHCIATSSCTGALHIALRTIGLAPGDEVILPEITWVASAAPITYEKATPVFVDIDPLTWCIDVRKVEAAITPRTKAIIAVHLYGNLCDMSSLRDIADRHRLFLIEDAAEALGSTWRERQAGSIGDMGVYSFHGTKTLTTGEGGLLAIQREDLFDKALIQANHGRKSSKRTIFWMDEIGVKYKMSNIQAAIGCAQLERIDELVTRKREIFSYYYKALVDLPVAMNIEAVDERNSYWLPAVVSLERLDENRRDAMLAKANEVGIGLRPFFYPLTRFPMFQELPQSPVAARVSRAGLNLPSFHDMTQEDMDVVIRAVRKGLS